MSYKSQVFLSQAMQKICVTCILESKQSYNQIYRFIINLNNETLEKVIIYNQLAQQVKEVTTNEINISNLANGVYFVKTTSQSGKTAIKKVIKN